MSDKADNTQRPEFNSHPIVPVPHGSFTTRQELREELDRLEKRIFRHIDSLVQPMTKEIRDAKFPWIPLTSVAAAALAGAFALGQFMIDGAVDPIRARQVIGFEQLYKLEAQIDRLRDEQMRRETIYERVLSDYQKQSLFLSRPVMPESQRTLERSKHE